MQETLQIYLLGSPQIFIGEQAVTGWPSRAAEAVIAYVVSAETPTPRSKLVDLIWPDSNPKQAQANLRTILTKIRKLLGDYFAIDRQTIGLRSDMPVWIDSVELAQAITATATLEQLASAVDLYRASFLFGLELRGGYTFEEWLIIKREQLERLVVNALQRLANSYLQIGNYQLSERFAARWVALDAYSEDAMRNLLWSQLRLGRRNEVLQRYAAFAQLLSDELGIDPASTTQAVADRARHMTQLGAHNLPPARTPFVGRSAELERLLARL
ncbi:MAG TPA: hypothetical protein ENJ56_05190, partial [Anaerolineae bacterium]|nr:hypothetical protein [Anaerolineae bacterium]